MCGDLWVYDEAMNTSLSRLITGFIILLLGVGFLLDSLSIIQFNTLFSTWWPVLIIIGGLGALASNYRRPIFPLFFILAGVLLQLRALEVLEFNVFSLIWPAIIIAIGLSMLLGRTPWGARTTKEHESDLFAFLSGVDSRNKSDDYRGGKANALLGGINLDLRDAQIRKTAHLNTFAFMGGIEVRVPREWRVTVSGMPLLGGWEDKTQKPESTKAPVLTIDATCIMGGIEIKN